MRRRASAFTLVELLVSIVLFSAAVPALCLMVNAGIEAVAETSSGNEAFNLARNEIEKCFNISYDTLKNEVSRGERYNITRIIRQVSSTGGSGGHSYGVKRVTVSVSRRSDGKEMAVLTTDITGGGK